MSVPGIVFDMFVGIINLTILECKLYAIWFYIC